MNPNQQYIELHSGPPAGLTVRSNSEGATIGMWTSGRELIASLNPHQVQWLVSALTSPTSLVQLTGNKLAIKSFFTSDAAKPVFGV